MSKFIQFSLALIMGMGANIAGAVESAASGDSCDFRVDAIGSGGAPSSFTSIRYATNTQGKVFEVRRILIPLNAATKQNFEQLIAQGPGKPVCLKGSVSMASPNQYFIYEVTH